MPQNTNLNVSPYFDDFDEDKNYKRVLFKPGTPIQSRELSSLQSILQNQIESFGQHFFKEGAKVIPGQTSYDGRVDYIRLDPVYFGVNINTYIDQLVDTNIVGQTTGISAKVELAISDVESDLNTNTLYFRYATSDTTDFSGNKFKPGEILLTDTDIVVDGVVVVRANSPFATVIAENPTGNASIASVNEGVYFIRGHFVKVLKETIIVDQYSITPSARIGFLIEEDFITSYDDETLNDNAQGFSNFAAPGADRLRIAVKLIKKAIDDFNDENFIELMRVVDGVLQEFTPSNSNDAYFRDLLAKRTFDESGNYLVKNFEVFAKENLNDGKGNNGVYTENQTTSSGQKPSESLLTLDISPGKAYVEGYDIEKISSSLIDIQKPRTTKLVPESAINFQSCASVVVNNVYGSPRVGFAYTDTITLVDSRVNNSSPTAISGNEIGLARIYDFYPLTSIYTNDTTQYECLIYDINTFVKITLGSNITLNVPAKVEGVNSGATGFLRQSISNSNIVVLYDTKGTFDFGEQIKVNQIRYPQTITSVIDYGFSDVKSFFTTDSVTASSFSADLILDSTKQIAPTSTQFTITSGGSVTIGITTASVNPPKVGDIVQYTISGNSVSTYNKVSAVSSNLKSFTVVAVSDNASINSGALPGSTISVNDLVIVNPTLKNKEKKDLYEILPHYNISSINLDNSRLSLKKSYTANVSSSTFTVTETDVNLFFKQFNVTEYNLSYSDGTIEVLTPGKVVISNSGKTLTITQLSKSSSSNAILIASLEKINVKAKEKVLVNCATVTINRSIKAESGTGAGTLNDGLTYSAVYGTRVQDDEICLNVPEVIKIVDIFESNDQNDPILPKIDLVEINGDFTTILPGQVVNGKTSKAIARIISTTASSITFSYVNEFIFQKNEIISVVNSTVSAKITAVNTYSKDISNSYLFDGGSRPEYVDYGKIVKKAGVEAPVRRVTVVFDYYTTPSGDTGDFICFSSFAAENYKESIPQIYGNVRATDAIDIRPRVSNYNPAVNTLSPFEFGSRNFVTSNSNVANPIINGSSIILSYSYYLGRIDKLYLTRSGIFQIRTGVPSENPVAPIESSKSLNIATITLNPYTYNVKYDVKIESINHKRYTMRDIEKLEERISTVEKITSLSLLETNTKNLSIKDATTGLDRFKSGFFVDNFNNHSSHTVGHPDFKASIDPIEGVLRPSHYTTSIDLSNSVSESSNIAKKGKLITLSYTEVEKIKQPFATRIENINPFSVVTWTGTLALNPSSDTWFDEKRLDVNNVKQEGNYNALMQALGADPNTGVSPVDWGSWESMWSGRELIGSRELVTSVSIQSKTTPEARTGTARRDDWPFIAAVFESTTTRTLNSERELEETYRTLDNQSRSGVQFKVSEQTDTVNLGSRIVSREIIPFCRERNIELIAKRVKPSTLFFPFFNGIDVFYYTTPKLLEIEMVSGVFVAGEAVEGFFSGSSYSVNIPTFKFKVANANHKYGSISNPSEVYEKNPYNLRESLPQNYSSTSSILNIDTSSLELKLESDFYGHAISGMRLRGTTSNAVATVKTKRLVSDESGTFLGSFYIPNPNFGGNPRFQTGAKTFLLISDPDNKYIPGEVISQVEATFTSSGELNVTQETTLSTRNSTVQRIPAAETRVVEGRITETKDLSPTSSVLDTVTTQRIGDWYDPLAESFIVSSSGGFFLTSVEVYFQSKDPVLPVSCQIRPLSGGVPTSTILPFAEVTYNPSQVSVSDNASAPTKFIFDSPIYLKDGGEYAIVLVTDSSKYLTWISRMGEVDISSANNPEAQRIIVSQQPYLGSLFKSQNGATWDPSQLEDLKFTIYGAKFTTSPGTFISYNPTLGLGNGQIAKLRIDPVTSISNQLVIGLGNTITTPLTPGVTVSQFNNTNATGILVNTTGSIKIQSTTALTSNNVGSGLTPSSGSYTYTNVDVVSVTGIGTGAKAQVTVTNGALGVSTVTTGGQGYSLGDVVTLKLGALSQNVRYNVGIISAYNSISLTDVQGTFDLVNQLSWIVPSGPGVGIASTFASISPVIPSTFKVDSDKDGLHFKVNHRNHGMHSKSNKLSINNISSDIPPVSLREVYTSSSTQPMKVTSVGIFTSFENVSVSSTNPGYIYVNGEVMGYTGVDAGASPPTLTGITRGVDSTVSTQHELDLPVYKYELSGVSLRRINKTHSMNTTNELLKNGIDEYYLKIDTTSIGSGIVRDGTVANGFPILKFNKTKQCGGNTATATQNIQYEAITPNIQYISPEGTQISGRIRTVSGTSVDGTETSFIDQGFDEINLNRPNILNSPRLICSQINETAFLTNIPNNKSLALEVFLQTNNPNVSPVIDLDRLNLITTTNRIDSPVSDFISDSRVNQPSGDPHAAVYVSKKILLQNPASSIDVRFSALKYTSNDIRILYKVFRPDSPDSSQPYVLFPGLTGIGDGTSNTLQEDPTRIMDYSYKVDNLQPFTGFMIKIILAGTNQATPPQLSNLSVIALA